MLSVRTILLSVFATAPLAVLGRTSLYSVEALCDTETLDLVVANWDAAAGGILSQQWRSNQCPLEEDPAYKGKNITVANTPQATRQKACCNAHYDTAFFNIELLQEREDARKAQQRARRGCCELCNPAFTSPSGWFDPNSLCKSGLQCVSSKNGASYCIPETRGEGIGRRLYNVGTDILPTAVDGVVDGVKGTFHEIEALPSQIRAIPGEFQHAKEKFMGAEKSVEDWFHHPHLW